MTLHEYTNAPIHYVLLDMDGTLVDTAPGLYAALNELLRENSRPPVTVDPVRGASGTDALLRHGLRLSNDAPISPAMQRRFIQLYRDRLDRPAAGDDPVFPGMRRVLGEIELSGRRWGIVTDKAEELATLVLRHTGLIDRCACLVGGDTVARRKPHADPLRQACRLLSARPENTLYIGDSGNDVIAGRDAGIRVLYAAYGYNEGYPDDLPPAHGVIDRPADILSWLDRTCHDDR